MVHIRFSRTSEKISIKEKLYFYKIEISINLIININFYINNEMTHIDADNYMKYGFYYNNKFTLIHGNLFLLSEGTFRVCPNIKELTLFHVSWQIENSFNLFTSLSNLTHLNIIDYKFTFNKKFIGGLNNLIFLELISGKVDLEDDFFSDNPKIDVLRLANNGIKNFNGASIRGTKITKISIFESYDYKVIEENSFNHPTLEHLNFSKNNIARIEDKSFSSSIKSIEFFDNPELQYISHTNFPFGMETLTMVRNYSLKIDDIKKLKEKVKKIITDNDKCVIDNYIYYNDKYVII